MLSFNKRIKLKIKKIIYRNSLQKIGECTGSDKVYGHNFIPIYQNYFHDLRKRKLNILEIGIGGYEDPNDNRATTFFSKLTDGLNYKEFLGDYKPSMIEEGLEFIHFYHNIIIIKKNTQGKKSLFVKDGKLLL